MEINTNEMRLLYGKDMNMTSLIDHIKEVRDQKIQEVANGSDARSTTSVVEQVQFRNQVELDRGIGHSINIKV
jgi:hypothetical protein